MTLKKSTNLIALILYIILLFNNNAVAVQIPKSQGHLSFGFGAWYPVFIDKKFTFNPDLSFKVGVENIGKKYNYFNLLCSIHGNIGTRFNNKYFTDGFNYYNSAFGYFFGFEYLQSINSKKINKLFWLVGVGYEKLNLSNEEKNVYKKDSPALYLGLFYKLLDSEDGYIALHTQFNFAYYYKEDVFDDFIIPVSFKVVFGIKSDDLGDAAAGILQLCCP